MSVYRPSRNFFALTGSGQRSSIAAILYVAHPGNWGVPRCATNFTLSQCLPSYSRRANPQKGLSENALLLAKYRFAAIKKSLPSEQAFTATHFPSAALNLPRRRDLPNALIELCSYVPIASSSRKGLFSPVTFAGWRSWRRSLCIEVGA